MKNIVYASLALVVLASCASSRHSAALQSKYTVVADTETKVLKGYIDRSILENDTTFKWFAENMKYGSADPAAVEAFKNNSDKFSMVVFGGTWCHDTQNLLPVFYRLLDKSGYPDN